MRFIDYLEQKFSCIHSVLFPAPQKSRRHSSSAALPATTSVPTRSSLPEAVETPIVISRLSLQDDASEGPRTQASDSALTHDAIAGRQSVASGHLVRQISSPSKARQKRQQMSRQASSSSAITLHEGHTDFAQQSNRTDHASQDTSDSQNRIRLLEEAISFSITAMPPAPTSSETVNVIHSDWPRSVSAPSSVPNQRTTSDDLVGSTAQAHMSHEVISTFPG